MQFTYEIAEPVQGALELRYQRIEAEDRALRDVGSATLERPRRITIAARKGLFEAFEVEWHVDTGSRGCRVTLS